MAIYVVLSEEPSPTLTANIERIFPGDNHYAIAPNQWLIWTDRVDATVSKDLEISDGRAGIKAAVFRIAGTGAGWHSKALWEWLAVKSAT
jgi:hypothetical protein